MKGVAFVIRTYFRPNKLEKTIDSIIKINYVKKEIIVVVDANDLGAREIIKKYKSYNLKELVINENSATKAWNLGILNSGYNIVCVLPDDVELNEKTIESALKHLKRERVAAVGFPVTSTNPSLAEKLTQSKYIGVITHRTYTIMPVTIFKKDILISVGLYREDMGPPKTIHEDWELGTRIRKHGYRIIIDGTVVSRHLEGESELSKVNGGRGHQLRNNVLISITKGFYSYLKSYIIKNWWSTLQVLKVSPLGQLMEYILYYTIPIIFIILILIDPWVALLYYPSLAVIIWLYYFMMGYYKTLSLRERLLYPLIVVTSRVLRAHGTILGYLYNLYNRLKGR